MANSENLGKVGKPPRAFIIGDRDNGLTIVITDPVMVVHYSNDDLKNAAINQMSNEEPIVSMAAVVQDILPMLRGVDVTTMRSRENDLRQGVHGDFTLQQEEGLFAELDYARTIGRIIRNNGSVCDVDFCVALDIDPSEIVAKGRNAGPGNLITDYLTKYSDVKDSNPKTVSTKPQVFNIGILAKDELTPLAPWQDPKP